MQRSLVACCDGADQANPILLGNAGLGSVGVKQIAERARLGFMRMWLSTHSVDDVAFDIFTSTPNRYIAKRQRTQLRISVKKLTFLAIQASAVGVVGNL